MKIIHWNLCTIFHKDMCDVQSKYILMSILCYIIIISLAAILLFRHLGWTESQQKCSKRSFLFNLRCHHGHILRVSVSNIFFKYVFLIISIYYNNHMGNHIWISAILDLKVKMTPNLKIPHFVMLLMPKFKGIGTHFVIFCHLIQAI